MLARYCLKKASSAPFVFLHGFLGNHNDWKPIADKLPFHAIALDLPGHGNSPFTEDFCAALLQTLADLPPFHLIGYSMGGRLAAQFAAKHPEKIASLTLLSTHLGLKTEEEKKNRLEKDLALAEKILTIPIDEFLIEWYDQPLFRTLVSTMDIRSMRKEQNREGLARALLEFSLAKQGSIQSNRLLVGEYDTLYREHYRTIPHTVIPNAGHAIHLENPDAVARELYDL